MKRTTLGNGIINFKQFSRYFKKKKVNISIELAAHITRHSQLFDKNFSKFHTISKKKLKIFKNFIKEKSINENPLTLWELENDIYKSSKQEKIQFNKSLQFLKTL
jgi:biopolymer transport protein ExbB/TolQ